MMKEMMIDLEAMNTRPSAIVLSVGAVVWETSMGEAYYPGADESHEELGYKVVARFLRKPSITPQTMALRTMSEDTLMWWMRQDPTARAEAFDPVRCDLECMFASLYKFATDYKITRFWASPSTFDFPILESLAEQFGFEVPWSYRQKYDVRTVINEASYSAKDHVPLKNLVGVAHTPVYDCEWQIDLLTAARQKIKRRMG